MLQQDRRLGHTGSRALDTASGAMYVVIATHMCQGRLTTNSAA